MNKLQLVKLKFEDFKSHHNRVKYYKILMFNLKLSNLRKQELINSELRKLIKHAYDTVPYYRKVFDKLGLTPEDIQCKKDLYKLPILTKEDIRNNTEDLISKNYNIKNCKLIYTGGSTGQPLGVYVNKDYLDWHRAVNLRGFTQQDYHFDRCVRVWGTTFDNHSFKDKLGRLLRGELRLDGHILTDKVCKKYLETIKSFKPKVLIGYAHCLYTLAQYAVRNNIRICVPVIIQESETLFDFQKSIIKKAFKGKILDSLGMRETALKLIQTEEDGCYTATEDVAILESVRNSMVITDLKNYVMPLIRYKNEDVCSISEEQDGGFTKVDSIEGRLSDRIILRDGIIINPLFMMYLVYENPNSREMKFSNLMLQYKIVQEDYERFVVYIVDDTNKNYDYIKENFKLFIGESIDVEIRRVDSIPLTRAGKRRYVVSEIKN